MISLKSFGTGLCAGQSSSSTPNSLILYEPLWTLLCALVHSHVGRGHLQTVLTKLGAWSCPKALGILNHSEFLSLELRCQAQHLKNIPQHNHPSPKLYTWYNTLRQVAFSWQRPNPDSINNVLPLL
ncbi:hypothetical protein ILYODFUR_038660 [Ilyodon furcidens]|uniref:Uncharacterized protein n=1 Tax=Ilyodon furcidens TaxID=33524 RepID=A0ABV0TUL9_9TELE